MVIISFSSRLSFSAIQTLTLSSLRKNARLHFYFLFSLPLPMILDRSVGERMLKRFLEKWRGPEDCSENTSGCCVSA